MVFQTHPNNTHTHTHAEEKTSSNNIYSVMGLIKWFHHTTQFIYEITVIDFGGLIKINVESLTTYIQHNRVHRAPDRPINAKHALIIAALFSLHT